MLTGTSYNEEMMLIDAANHQPSVSIVVSFYPMMSSKSDIQERLKLAIAKVEKELSEQYTADKSLPVLLKLHRLVEQLNYNTHKKSIAIFASPVIEKVYYLDIPVDERIVVGDSFEIRDLVYSKKQNIQYLVLLLSAERSSMYLGNCSKFLLIKSNHPQNIFAYKNEIPERVANFSDPEKRKEILLDKFLHNMDDGLSIVLNAYHLPVFVIGPERVLGHFKKITKNLEKLVGFIHGNYNEATEPEIRNLLQPYIEDWRKIKQQSILQEIEKAASDHKLSFGIHEVRKQAARKNCRLLVVEKDFMLVDPNTHPTNNAFFIKDEVDDVMEKVLQNGGDVEFVDKDVLKEHGRIALIQFY